MDWPASVAAPPLLPPMADMMFWTEFSWPKLLLCVSHVPCQGQGKLRAYRAWVTAKKLTNRKSDLVNILQAEICWII
jgi:hypothetical protein